MLRNTIFAAAVAAAASFADASESTTFIAAAQKLVTQAASAAVKDGNVNKPVVVAAYVEGEMMGGPSSTLIEAARTWDMGSCSSIFLPPHPVDYRYAGTLDAAFGSSPCLVVIVPPAAGSSAESVISASAQRAGADAHIRSLHLAVPSVPGAAPAGFPRRLADNTTVAAQIYMVPDIIEGLLVSFLMIFFVAIGLFCTANIPAPDTLHSTTLPAGKEY